MEGLRLLLEDLAVDGQLLVRRRLISHRQRWPVYFIRSVGEIRRNERRRSARFLPLPIFDHFLLVGGAEDALEDRIRNIRLVLLGVFGRRYQDNLVAERDALLLCLPITRAALPIQNADRNWRWKRRERSFLQRGWTDGLRLDAGRVIDHIAGSHWTQPDLLKTRSQFPDGFVDIFLFLLGHRWQRGSSRHFLILQRILQFS